MITITGNYMIKTKGLNKNTFIVDLDFDSFDDITTDYVSLDESDEIIKATIAEKYGDYPDFVQVKGECV